jgi:hypothetical protein
VLDVELLVIKLNCAHLWILCIGIGMGIFHNPGAQILFFFRIFAYLPLNALFASWTSYHFLYPNQQQI